jgi:hypothetical protein
LCKTDDNDNDHNKDFGDDKDYGDICDEEPKKSEQAG